MERSIKILRELDPEWANLYILNALRYYSEALEGGDSKVMIAGMPNEQLKNIARQYIKWDDQVVLENTADANTFTEEGKLETEDDLEEEDLVEPTEEEWEAIHQKAVEDLDTHYEEAELE